MTPEDLASARLKAARILECHAEAEGPAGDRRDMPAPYLEAGRLAKPVAAALLALVPADDGEPADEAFFRDRLGWRLSYQSESRTYVYRTYETLGPGEAPRSDSLPPFARAVVTNDAVKIQVYDGDDSGLDGMGGATARNPTRGQVRGLLAVYRVPPPSRVREAVPA